jgi:hypothetical protein
MARIDPEATETSTVSSNLAKAEFHELERLTR